MGTAAEPVLEAAIASEMRRYRVSRSFVLATCAAFALGVDVDAQNTYKANPDAAPRLYVVRGNQHRKRKAG